MDNMQKVTQYIKQNSSGVTAGIINTIVGNQPPLWNGCWRVIEFIPNTTSFETTTDINLLLEAGIAVGKFQKQLDGFKAEELIETIVKFHNTKYRFNNFEQAIQSKQNQNEREKRFKLAEKEIQFVIERKKITGIIIEMLEKGKIPLRVTHNDTKLSNILFDKTMKKAVCLIDLDTVMPGSMLYDFGEGIRTSCTLAKEDEEDLNSVIWEKKRYEAFTNGFLQEVNEKITKQERELLPQAAILMTFENGIRFLTDYLNGDMYFRTNPEISEHNLKRAKTQLELVRQMEQNKTEMMKINF